MLQGSAAHFGKGDEALAGRYPVAVGCPGSEHIDPVCVLPPEAAAWANPAHPPSH